MKLLVPVKRVPDPYGKPKPLPDGSGLDVGSKFEINPFDEIALEAAVRLKEAGQVTEIVAVSVGADSEDQLRKALAMGADRAILVEADSGGYDSLGIAGEIKAVAESEKPDMVLMGKQGTDFDANQVGQMLAAKLNWPQATFASKIELAGASAKVSRETDTGEETLELPLPAVVTCDLRLAEPRYIALPGIIKARSKPIDRIPPANPPAPKIKVVGYEPLPPRAAGRKVGSVDELVTALREAGALA
jgi:electron transfer flavoprotein beta subunit